MYMYTHTYATASLRKTSAAGGRKVSLIFTLRKWRTEKKEGEMDVFLFHRNSNHRTFKVPFFDVPWVKEAESMF